MNQVNVPGRLIAAVGVIVLAAAGLVGMLMPVSVEGVDCGTAWRPDDSKVDLAETMGTTAAGLQELPDELRQAGVSQAIAAQRIRSDCADDRRSRGTAATMGMAAGGVLAGVGLLVHRRESRQAANQPADSDSHT